MVTDRLDSMSELSGNLTKLKGESKLFVIRGDPVILLPEVCEQW